MSRPVIFLGPSMTLTEARELLDADYRPPAAQGDLLRALSPRPTAIALIDGVFRNEPTVRHREILWILAEGIPVFGAASMGALRAAELCGEGMIGVGLAYRWYRRFPMAPDDAVALAHGPAELGSPPLGDALIDIQRSLARAQRAGALSQADRLALTAEAAATPFADRRLDRLGGPDLSAHRVAQKSADARALLDRLARHQKSGDWPRPACPSPPVVNAWIDDLQAAGWEVTRSTKGARHHSRVELNFPND